MHTRSYLSTGMCNYVQSFKAVESTYPYALCCARSKSFIYCII